MFKLTELLFSNSKIQIRNLATFVYKAFEERNRIVYIVQIQINMSSIVAIVVV